jgi:hypothetical protein
VSSDQALSADGSFQSQSILQRDHGPHASRTCINGPRRHENSAPRCGPLLTPATPQAAAPAAISEPWCRDDASSSIETQEPGCRRPEAAQVLVEVLEVRFVVDVHPLTPGFSHISKELCHQSSTEPSPLIVGIDRRVEQERVVPAVPDSMDEAHEHCAVEGAHPAHAESTQPLRPRQYRPRSTEGGVMQPRQNPVVDAAP